MATRRVGELGATRDPLVTFYADLGRLAADEGELKTASAAYRKAVVFARLMAGCRESTWAASADHVQFDNSRADEPG